MKSIFKLCLPAILIIINATSQKLLSMFPEKKDSAAHVSIIATHPSEDTLLFQLCQAIKYEKSSLLIKILKDLKKYYPSTTPYCLHTINALGAAAALNKLEMFEWVRLATMATAQAETNLAVYAGVALERATMAGWTEIVAKILSEKVAIPIDYFQATLLTACAKKDHNIMRVFVDQFGFEQIREIIRMPIPQGMRIYLPDGYEAPCPIRFKDLLSFLDECKSK